MSVRRLMYGSVAGLAGVLLWHTAPAIAHHSSAPFYDATKKAEAQGAVSRLLIRNPHSFLYFEATDEKGEKVEWQVELGAAASLIRTGWTADTLKPGTIVKDSRRALKGRTECAARRSPAPTAVRSSPADA